MTAPEQRTGRPGFRLYSVEEAADLLGIGRTFMFRLIATGEVESLKVGRRRKIGSDALDRYIARLIEQQSATTSTSKSSSVRPDNRAS